MFKLVRYTHTRTRACTTDNLRQSPKPIVLIRAQAKYLDDTYHHIHNNNSKNLLLVWQSEEAGGLRLNPEI